MLHTNVLTDNNERLIEALLGDLKTPVGSLYFDTNFIEIMGDGASLLVSSFEELHERADGQEIDENISFRPTPCYQRASGILTVPVMRCIWVNLSYADDLHYAYLQDRLSSFSCPPSAIVDNREELDAYWLLAGDLTTVETVNVVELTMCWLATSLQGKALNAENDENDVQSFKRYMKMPGTINYSSSNPQPVVVNRLDLDLRYSLKDLSFMAHELAHEKWPEAADQLGIPKRFRIGSMQS